MYIDKCTRPVCVVLGVYAQLTDVIKAIFSVYCQVLKVNALLGVYALSTVVIQSTVHMYCQLR
jgi:hypothetical protein